MSKKKKKGPAVNMGLDEWFGTYADCITLLLCFFVLLYASSTTDSAKVQYIVQLFKTGGTFINTVVDDKPRAPNANDDGNSEVPLPPINDSNNGGNITEIGSGMQPQALQGMLVLLQEAISSENMASAVNVEQGADGKLRISFEGDMLFDPGTAELSDLGRRAVQLVIPTIDVFSDYTASLSVEGHTAEMSSQLLQRPNGSTELVDDWDLSSYRALSVLHFVQDNAKLEKSKYILNAFGQYRDPVKTDNDPDLNEDSKKRRVELIISRNDNEPDNTYYLLDILKYDYNQQTATVDMDGKPINPGISTDYNTAEIIDNGLTNKYGKGSSSVGPVVTGGDQTLENLFPDNNYYETYEDGTPIIPVEATVPPDDAS